MADFSNSKIAIAVTAVLLSGSFSMYVIAASEWLVVAPLIAAGMLVVGGWVVVLTKPQSVQTDSQTELSKATAFDRSVFVRQYPAVEGLLVEFKSDSSRQATVEREDGRSTAA